MHDPEFDLPAVSTKRSGVLPTIGGKYFALAVLFAMNLLNYVDRYSFFAAGTKIQEALHIDDKWFGVLGVSFMIVYTLVSPAMGWMGDRYSRKLLLAGGVGLWSFATVFTAFSADFYHMFFWRALLGLGEASYGAIAPALIADLFPVKERGRAMGVYYLALPVGSALGYILGGTIAVRMGWQAVFFVVGLPGAPGRTRGTGHQRAQARSIGGAFAASYKADRPGLAADYLVLFRTPTFLYNTAGMAAVTFATGAYAAWGSTFYQRVHGLSATDAGKWIGLPCWSGRGHSRDPSWGWSFAPTCSVRKFTRRAYLLFAAVAMVLIATPLGVLGHPRHRPIIGFRWPVPVRCVGAVVDGAGAVQHGDGQRGSLEPTSHRVRLLHLPDPPVWRHQLAHPTGMDLDPVRQTERSGSPIGRFFDSISAKPVGPSRRHQPDRRHALGRSGAGAGVHLLPAGIAAPPRESPRRRTKPGQAAPLY